MNISGIRPSAGFYSYNSISDIKGPEAPLEISKLYDETAKETSPAISEEEIAAARSLQTYDSGDYAQEYKAGETYDLKGVNSDIRTLDVEKAISDMQKDDMLAQYQYFVGDRQGAAASAARAEEDFSL